MGIDSNGLITGTITSAPATFSNVTVKVTDAAGVTANSAVFTWTVKAKPTQAPLVNQTTTVGATVNVALPAPTCPNSPCTLTLNNGPTGLIIVGGFVVGTVGGTPQTYSNVTITATDAAGVTGTSTVFTWTAKAGPTVTTPANQSSNIGAVASLAVASTCPNTPCTFTMSGAPTGLSINSASGLISGTVGGLPQTYANVRVTITDVYGVSVQSSAFTWTISYPPLQATTPADQVSTLNNAITAVQLTASGGSGSYNWSGTLPAGLGMTAGGLITGTPTALGSGPVTLTVTDAATSNFLTISFNWTVLARPTVTAPANQTTTVGATINLSLTSTCPNTPCSYTLNSGPAGLSINSSGLITGTITSAAQTFSNVTVTITDAAGATATSGVFTWTVKAKPTVTAPANQTTTVGATISLALTSTCANTPCSYVLNNGPAGLTINSSGLITGTITSAAQTFSNVTVTITDAATVSAKSTVFTWTVKAPPTITPGNQTTTLGAAVNVTPPSTCQNTPCTFTMTGAPTGLSINSSTGAITGTVTGTTQNNVIVTITDAASVAVASNPFIWTVLAAPTVTAPANQTTTIGATISLQLVSSCPNTPCTYTLINGPATLSINNSGLISGTITSAAQTFSNVTVRITDAAGVFGTSSVFTWKVNVAPTVSNPGNQTANGGAADSLVTSTLVAGGTAPYTYSAAGLPVWLSINASTGLISGTAPTARSITSGITVSVTDSTGVSATSSAFQWVVSYPSIAIPNQVTARSKAVSIDLDNYVTGGTAPYTFAIANQPAWLTYTLATHVLAGTSPSSNGTTSNITVTVTDSAGAVVTSAAFSWQIVTSTTLVWSVVPDRTSLPGVAATSLDVKPLVTNDKANYAAVGLPPGLSIAPTTGIITGTPTLAGSYHVTVSATDNTNSVSIPSTPFIWQVTSLMVGTITSQSTPRNTAGSFPVSTVVSLGISPYTYSATGLPAWLTINANTGVISGTAPSTTSNTTGITVTVTDLTGAVVTSSSFSWRVT